jgi:hypothetical protein
VHQDRGSAVGQGRPGAGRGEQQVGCLCVRASCARLSHLRQRLLDGRAIESGVLFHSQSLIPVREVEALHSGRRHKPLATLLPLRLRWCRYSNSGTAHD